MFVFRQLGNIEQDSVVFPASSIASYAAAQRKTKLAAERHRQPAQPLNGRGQQRKR
jgi:hypothetical protein